MTQARYRSMKWTAASMAAILPLFISTAANATEPFFMGLGDLPGGMFQSKATGISADGSTVVGTGSRASGDEAFRWTPSTGMVGLGGNSTAADVSADGSVIVGTWGSQAFRWTHSTGLVGLGDFPAGPFRSFGYAVSDDGSVVVGLGTSVICSPGSGRCGPFVRGFRWTEDSGMRISVRTPTDISGDGSVIVGGSIGGSLNSSAWGVSADGSVIVGQGNSDEGAEAVRWTKSSGIVGLGILPGFEFSLARDVSADGSVVVGTVGFGVNTYAGAFVWDNARGMRDLRDVLTNDHGLGASLAGWTLNYATAVSADGQVVVGYGTNPGGQKEAWIARLVSEPALPGDYNGDNVVDAADYVVWRKTDGTQAGYDAWRTHFGRALSEGWSASIGAAVVPRPLPGAVPEPNIAGLIASAVTGIAALRARRCPRH